MKTIEILLLLLLFPLAGGISAQQADSLKSRPATSGPIPVQIAVLILDVREIDGSKQSFAADVFVRLSWKDDRLANQGSRSLPLSAVWNPVAQIVNRIAVQTTLPDNLEVDNTGKVLYRQRFIGTFSCMMDLRNFPFDEQKIPIRLAVPGVLPQEVRFVPDPDGAMASRLSITDWQITGWSVRDEPYQLVPGGRSVAGYVFEFGARRYFYFFLVQIILPLTLILGMSWIVFWIDRTQAGPRISISITAMLTTVAYRLMIGNFLPRLPFLTRLDYFVFGSTLLVFFALVFVVAIARLMLLKKEELATRMDIHARWIFPLSFLLLTCLAFWL